MENSYLLLVKVALLTLLTVDWFSHWIRSVSAKKLAKLSTRSINAIFVIVAAFYLVLAIATIRMGTLIAKLFDWSETHFLTYVMVAYIILVEVIRKFRTCKYKSNKED